MERLAAHIVAILAKTETGIPFAEVVGHVAKDLQTDEAGVKAAILRLSSEGQLEITADWDVRLLVSQPSQAA